MAGSNVAARHFPFLAGRSPSAQLRLEDPGVWEKHIQIHFQPGEAFTFTTQSGALTLINSEPRHEGVLKNGDLIEIGSTRMRFWLAPAQQRAMRSAEVFTWIALVGLFVGQGALILGMLR